jgi:maltose alpha-D-glucosyltransferase / alpha-amylase
MSDLWYRDAVIYEVPVRAFRDESGDGVGDFRGLTSKLDYIRDLGVTTLWVLPFYPSPLRDDGYDIADYKAVHPDYGTMRDFKRFLREAHDRDLEVITELVINHTSDQHPWFQRARRAPAGSTERDFYVWSDTTDRYRDARIIFQDTEISNWTWDPVANAYYWHRFFSHQPDLNFENPAVHGAVFDVLDFWLDLGVDGLRLDAVPYLYERDGTMCENLPETHGFLKQLRSQVDQRHSGRMLLAEANQWPEDAVAYFGDGDECHMAFHFPLMPRLFMALRQENRFPIVDILEQTPDIPESAAWAIFLRNHDELTLEMVTDEERDYMYRVYAEDPQARINVGIRRRLAPLLGNDRRELELMNGLLLSLPGTPVIYYGDEIGMGDNVYLGDRFGVRTPMQWSGERNAGFSEANPQRLYAPVITDPAYHYESVNVAIQRDNPNSLWWWMKRALALRRTLPELSRGAFEAVPSDNPKVLTFLRRLADRSVLVVANLSRHPQPVALELPEFAGYQPVELLGRTRFPSIGEGPYQMSTGPHDCYWFALEETQEPRGSEDRPRITVRGDIETVFRARAQLQRALLADVGDRRWFRSKAQTIRDGEIVDLIEVPGTSARIALVRVEYVEAEPEVYVVPLAAATGLQADRLSEEAPEAIVADVRGADDHGVLYDAMYGEELPRALLALVGGRKTLRGRSAVIAPSRVPGAGQLAATVADEPVTVGGLEQTNTTVFFGERLVMKLFRKVEPGINPEVEIGRYLTEDADLSNTPAVRGLLVLGGADEDAAFALIEDFVPNQGNAFDLTFDKAVLTLESVLARGAEAGQPSKPRHPLEVDEREMDLGRTIMGSALVDAEVMGRRIGELHLAVAKATDPAFAPEPLSTLQQRSLYQGLRTSIRTSIGLLKRRRTRLRQQDLALADATIGAEDRLLDVLRSITTEKIECDRIRIHGDLHLGQILYTGKDFAIIDFEGEPLRPLSQRRLKRLALQDIAGMIRSFHYAMVMAFQQVATTLGDEQRTEFAEWAHAMHRWTAAAFLSGYLETVEGSTIVPARREHFRVLLDALVVEKAAYELEYELNNRPDWVEIPLQGILETIR